MAAITVPAMVAFVAVAIILATLWHYERERRQERWRIENKHEQRMLAKLDEDGAPERPQKADMVRYSQRW